MRPGATRESRRATRARRRATPALTVLLAGAAFSACGDDGEAPLAPAGQAAAIARAKEIRAAVERWASADGLFAAQLHAAEARRLITGPTVTGLGGDLEPTPLPGEAGLLPGVDGSPGLASAVPGRCIEQDVLGGSWDDPKARWQQERDLIAAWKPDNNTFPQFKSHAQRVVGWATLTLETEDPAAAREYSGHAAGHAQVVLDALEHPGAASCPGG